MKKPKAVIFDMDGVLVDTEPFHYENENRMFRKLGLEVAEDEHARFVGVATDRMWHYLVESRNLPHTVAALTEMTIKQGLETLQLLENLPVSPGLVELLEKFCELKMPLAVATSSDAETMRFILQKTGLKKYFQIAVCRNDVVKSKPAPDVFLKAALLMNVAPADCLVFEDSRNGIAAAKAAGMLCIAYSGSRGQQNQSAADEFIVSFSEVNAARFEWMTD
jgi:HAD superfamily hydrolase (TIGR01509 family)